MQLLNDCSVTTMQSAAHEDVASDTLKYGSEEGRGLFSSGLCLPSPMPALTLARRQWWWWWKQTHGQ